MRIAIIPARGGSQRIPRKNIAMFMGRRMLAYPIEAAQESGLFDLIAVSTDDDEIASYAFWHDCLVIPRAYDDGTTGTQEIAARALDQLDANGAACVIYPCSPMLLSQDLQAGWDTLNACDPSDFAMTVGPDGQDAGCFYWGWTQAFRERRPLGGAATLNIPLPAARCLDINTPGDMAQAESMFNALRRANENH